VREQVRESYAAAAGEASASAETGCGCAAALTDERGREVFGSSLSGLVISQAPHMCV